MDALRAVFASLALPRFRRLWLLIVLSAFIPVVAWTVLFNVGFDLSESYVSATIPHALTPLIPLVLGPLCGVLADRCSRRRLVIGAQCVMAAALAAIGALILLDLLTIALLSALTLAVVAAGILLASARDVWVAELVPPRLLANGLVLATLAVGLAVVAGTALAALSILEWRVGFGWICLFLALVSLAALAVALKLPSAAPHAAARIGFLRELRAGVGYLARQPRQPRLRALWLFGLVVGACSAGAEQFLIERMFTEFGSLRLGTIEIVAAIGLGSAAVTISLAGLLGGGFAWPLLFFFAVLLAVGAWLGAAAVGADLLAAARHFVGSVAGIAILIIAVLTLINAKPQYYGRVLSLLVVAFGLGGAVHLTVLNFGDIWIAAQFDSRDSLWALGALAIAGTVLMLISWRRALGSPPEPGSAVAAMLGPPIAAFTPDLVARIALSRAQRGSDDEERFG